MALIYCSECRGKFSDTASACVHCGAPLAIARAKKRESPAKVIFVALIVTGVICVVVSFNSTPRKSAISTPPAPTINTSRVEPSQSYVPPSPTVFAGGTGTIKKNILAGVTEEVNSEINRIAASGDTDRIKALVLMDQVVVLYPGTTYRVTDPGIFCSQIRITSGDASGRTLYVATDALN